MAVGRQMVLTDSQHHAFAVLEKSLAELADGRRFSRTVDAYRENHERGVLVWELQWGFDRRQDFHHGML